jgi:hypothetical protein
MQQDRHRPWFRRRRIGFGWTPVTWQGWVITLVVAVSVTVALHVLRH